MKKKPSTWDSFLGQLGTPLPRPAAEPPSRGKSGPVSSAHETYEPAMSGKGWMTVKEVARTLGVSPQTAQGVLANQLLRDGFVLRGAQAGGWRDPVKWKWAEEDLP
jgi:hypothetical protein